MLCLSTFKGVFVISYCLAKFPRLVLQLFCTIASFELVFFELWSFSASSTSKIIGLSHPRGFISFLILLFFPMDFLCSSAKDWTQGTVPANYTCESAILTAFLRGTYRYSTQLKWPTHWFLVFSQLISFLQRKCPLSLFLNVLNNTVLNVWVFHFYYKRAFNSCLYLGFETGSCCVTQGLLRSSLCNQGWPQTWNLLCFNFLSAEFT